MGGYTPAAARNFDAIFCGYYDGARLMYAGRTPSGFTPALRDQLFKRFAPLVTEKCPLANLPEAKGGPSKPNQQGLQPVLRLAIREPPWRTGLKSSGR